MKELPWKAQSIKNIDKRQELITFKSASTTGYFV
jgi:hypothetical protein